MLQNLRDMAFTVSELLRETQHGGLKLTPLPPPQPRLGFKYWNMYQMTYNESLSTILQSKIQNLCYKLFSYN